MKSYVSAIHLSSDLSRDVTRRYRMGFHKKDRKKDLDSRRISHQQGCRGVPIKIANTMRIRKNALDNGPLNPNSSSMLQIKSRNYQDLNQYHLKNWRDMSNKRRNKSKDLKKKSNRHARFWKTQMWKYKP